jgi:tetratricopeptide (TPR) repeat protein
MSICPICNAEVKGKAKFCRSCGYNLQDEQCGSGNATDSLAWSNKGVALIKLGRYEEALQAADKAIKLDPNLALAWSIKGIALIDLGRYEEAVQAVDKAYELNPAFKKITSSAFRYFTTRARLVLLLSSHEAMRLRHYHVDTEHILLGLVLEGEGAAAKVLASLGVDLEKVRSSFEYIVGRDEKDTTGETLTPRAKMVIELAVDEARRLNHSYIGTAHLLLGLLQEGEGTAANILDSFGVSLFKVQKAMKYDYYAKDNL